MNGTADDDSTDPLVYIPAPLLRDLLEALKAANLRWPEEVSAAEDAVRAVTGFLLAIPAVRESGVVCPLQGLVAALPDLLRLATRFNKLPGELIEAYTDPDATTLAKGGTQLSMLVRFVEDATGGQIGAALQPARQLFEAVYDRVEGGRPALIWDAAPKPSHNRAHHITRAHLAAAVDWLFAANMSNADAKKWWNRPAEYERAHKWREQAMGGTASRLTISEFERLRPPRGESVSEADAKAKALELRTITEGRRR